MNIVFDLDGTLIDSSERMYQLFQKLIPESEFTKEQYWSLKRNKINHQMILEKYYPQYDFGDFEKKWLYMIEQDEYLDMDCNYPDTIEILDYLYKKHVIVLLTARQSRHGLERELYRLGLTAFFSHILVTEAQISKFDLLKKANIEKNEDDFFVSDMGKDILDGIGLGYKTVGITHGFMCKEKLREYGANYLIDKLTQLKEIV